MEKAAARGCSVLETMLIKGSIFLIVGALVAGGLGFPFSEDMILVTAGALSGRGAMFWPTTFLTCYFGVLFADFVTFYVARTLGTRAFEYAFFERILPAERREKAEDIFERLGGRAVFVARFLIGFRIPAFAMAGILKMPIWKFLIYDAVGLAITCPTVFFVGYFFSHRLSEIEAGLGDLSFYVLVTVASLAVMSVLFLAGRKFKRKAIEEAPKDLPPADSREL